MTTSLDERLRRYADTLDAALADDRAIHPMASGVRSRSARPLRLPVAVAAAAVLVVAGLVALRRSEVVASRPGLAAPSTVLEPAAATTGSAPTGGAAATPTATTNPATTSAATTTAIAAHVALGALPAAGHDIRLFAASAGEPSASDEPTAVAVYTRRDADTMIRRIEVQRAPMGSGGWLDPAAHYENGFVVTNGGPADAPFTVFADRPNGTLVGQRDLGDGTALFVTLFDPTGEFPDRDAALSLGAAVHRGDGVSFTVDDAATPPGYQLVFGPAPHAGADTVAAWDTSSLAAGTGVKVITFADRGAWQYLYQQGISEDVTVNGHPGVLHRSVTPASDEGAPVLAWRETPDEWIALVGDIGSTVADPDLMGIAAQFHLVPIDEWRRAIGTAPPATPASATATPASAPTTSKP